MVIIITSNIKTENKDPKVVDTLIRSYELQEEKLKQINEKIDKNEKNRGLNTGEKKEKE